MDQLFLCINYSGVRADGNCLEGVKNIMNARKNIYPADLHSDSHSISKSSECMNILIGVQLSS